MQILNYNLEAFLPYNEEDIEKFLMLCEEAINNITNDERPKYKLKSAVHELLINSLEHGYKKSPGKVSLSFKKINNFIFFEISDEGKGLDPSSVDLKREVSDLENITSRGWGLTLVNRFSDSLKIVPNTPKGTKVSLVIPLD